MIQELGITLAKTRMPEQPDRRCECSILLAEIWGVEGLQSKASNAPPSLDSGAIIACEFRREHRFQLSGPIKNKVVFGIAITRDLGDARMKRVVGGAIIAVVLGVLGPFEVSGQETSDQCSQA